MEYCDGETLFELMEKQQEGLGEAKALMIFKQLSDALEYMDRVNVCHRDIKLENIVIDKDLNIKLIDFGCAIIQKKNDLSTDYIGTEIYMAPEIKLQKPYDGKRADAFSSGVVLFILIKGYFPFTDDASKSHYCKFFFMLTTAPEKYWQKIQANELSDDCKDLFE